MKIIKVGSDFSGVGAFDYAMKRISEVKGFGVENVFACDMDKYARMSYLANHGEPKDYPMNVYDREIPSESLDIYMTSPPCQAFSLAGKRLGKDDEKGRGILFFNSHEFIQKNKPRYFIFENVKGLLSDDSGKTFDEWIKLLGGKSVNGTSVFFPYEDSVPYHIYYSVMNAKHYGVPQNRERVFIIGIRDDEDNNFSFPAEVPLEKRLKDILEENVDEKYFLSEKMVSFFIKNSNDNKLKGNGFRFKPKKDEDLIANSITTLSGSRMDDNYIEVGKWNDFKDKNGNVKGFEPLQDNVAPTLLSRAREDGSGQPVIKIHANTSKGFEEVTNEDSINFSNPHSKTRRGRVGKGVAQTLDTQCNQGVFVNNNLPNRNILHIFDGIIKLNDDEKRNTIEILSTMRKEIGEKEIISWGLRILEKFRQEDILQRGLHEEELHKQGYKTSRRTVNKTQQSVSFKIKANDIMRNLPKGRWERCTPCGRKSFKQFIRQFNEIMQRLSHEATQKDSDMQVDILPNESRITWLLRKTLPKIQEVWESKDDETQSIHSNYRIRRLTELEVFRLMDFPDSHVANCKKVGISNSQLYKQAGNSIVVKCLELIINNLKLV